MYLFFKHCILHMNQRFLFNNSYLEYILGFPQIVHTKSIDLDSQVQIHTNRAYIEFHFSILTCKVFIYSSLLTQIFNMRNLPTSFIHICISHLNRILLFTLDKYTQTKIFYSHRAVTLRSGYINRINALFLYFKNFLTPDLYTWIHSIHIHTLKVFFTIFFSSHFTVILYFCGLFTSRGYSQITFFYSNAIHICRPILLFHTHDSFMNISYSFKHYIYSCPGRFHSYVESIHRPNAFYSNILFIHKDRVFIHTDGIRLY